MKKVAGLYRTVGGYRKTMKVGVNDKCAICGEPATRKVECFGGGKGICEQHALRAAQKGYRVEPPISNRKCCECGLEMSEEESNHGTNETAGNFQLCSKCAFIGGDDEEDA